MTSPAPVQRSALVLWVALGVLGFGLLLGGSLATLLPPSRPSLPPISSSITVVRPTPNVLMAVKELARLETTTFHIERVIDLSDKQSRLFGLIQTADALLLVASADVTAGIDLGALRPEDVQADPVTKHVKITLPKAQILHTELDNARTYVHARHTGLLAERKEDLESRARQEAERTIAEAAQQAGILNRAQTSAQKIIDSLVRSLGYEQVEIGFRP